MFSLLSSRTQGDTRGDQEGRQKTTEAPIGSRRKRSTCRKTARTVELSRTRVQGPEKVVGQQESTLSPSGEAHSRGRCPLVSYRPRWFSVRLTADTTMAVPHVTSLCLNPVGGIGVLRQKGLGLHQSQPDVSSLEGRR